MTIHPGIAEMAARQQRALVMRGIADGRAGLQSMLGQSLQHPIGEYSRPSPYDPSRQKSIKDELQNEVDEWLKDTI